MLCKSVRYISILNKDFFHYWRIRWADLIKVSTAIFFYNIGSQNVIIICLVLSKHVAHEAYIIL